MKIIQCTKVRDITYFMFLQRKLIKSTFPKLIGVYDNEDQHGIVSSGTLDSF